MSDDARSEGTGLLWFAVAVVLVLAAAVAIFGGALIPTIGIAVVAAGLFLPVQRTAILAAVAVLSALFLIPVFDIDQPVARFGNVALASSLAILASWTIGQRLASIRRLSRTKETVFASVPDGLVVLAADGTIEECNVALTTLVPAAVKGAALHRLLGHQLADGSPCPGGCALDRPSGAGIVADESVTLAGRLLPIEYVSAEIDDGRAVVSLRDVTSQRETEQNRRILLEASARQVEQQEVLRALGAPQFTELPPVPGLCLDMVSRPAAPGAATGGDLVDVTTLADGRVLIMIADALGKGVISVRDAWQVLYIARAYVQAGVRLDDVVARTAATLLTDANHPDASLMIAVIDPATGRVDLAGGGHPPALLVRGNGATEWLEGTGSGVGEAPVVDGVTLTRQLTAEDSLVLYTDGVVDGGQDVFEGLSALRSSAAALRKRPAQGWAQTVLDAVQVPGYDSGNATVLLIRMESESTIRQTSATL